MKLKIPSAFALCHYCKRKNKEFIIDDMTPEQYKIVEILSEVQLLRTEFKFIKFSNPGFIDESAAHEDLKQ